jgi:KaiC/GvpD/RAD55 family RecA-like ATPase
MGFDEKAFLYALSSRPEDARKFATTFKPEWLHTAEYTPILAEIFAFTREHGEQPSIPTLHKIFKDKDAEAYNLRYKDALDSITENIPDRSMVVYTLDQARDTGVVRDFQEMSSSQGFLQKQAELDGSSLLTTMHKFFNKHGSDSDIRTMDIKSSIESLVEQAGFQPELTRVPCGIHVIDDWTGGGLRTKQLGIIMAPTGDGKSSVLVVMAHNISFNERQNVWLVTNELSLEEQTERMLSRITGKECQRIIDDPGIAFQGLERHWRAGADERLRMTEVNREVSMDDLEAEMMKWVNLIGWKPKVLVLDFIERMKPNDAGWSRDKIWDWVGAISRDMSRFAKRHNILVWTAAQTNRSGYTKGKGKSPLSLEMAQSSVKHLQEAACIIGMRQEELPDERIVMELADLKQRFSKRTKHSVFLECDLARMRITNTKYYKNEETEDDLKSPTSQKHKGYTPAEKQKQAQARKTAENN